MIRLRHSQVMQAKGLLIIEIKGDNNGCGEKLIKEMRTRMIEKTINYDLTNAIANNGKPKGL